MILINHIPNTCSLKKKIVLVHNFSGGSISINSMHLNETFCVTGSDDGYLRLWPLDFAYVYLEAGMSTISVAVVFFFS